MPRVRPFVSAAAPFVFLCSSMAAQPVAAQPAAGTHDLMPVPAQLDWQPGRLVLDQRFNTASVGVSDPRIDAALARTRVRLAAQTGLAFAGAGTGDRSTLVVAAKSAGLPVQAATEDESYELTVDARQARLSAPNPLGILRGLETVLQLVRAEGGKHLIPAVRISDRPRFPWRGLLIDPGRRFEPVEVIKRTLDVMAAVKLNVLHWHLSEDQGFRVESLAFPKLHQQGSDGLYYTQAQVREVIAHARLRGIRVVPEFDMPGHATSWLVGHPELGSAPGPFTLVRKWGIFDDVLDPTRDETYAFLDRFLGEMAGLFPDAYLHVGGDEVTPRQWNANPAILDYMYKHDLHDLPDLQAHFNLRVNEILARHGKRMVGWDEVLRPELPKNIVVQSWRGTEALARAAELGYEGILSNGYYLDLMFSAADHYAKDPLPPDSRLSAEARSRVQGGEACMWGEFVGPENIDSRLWPRGAAVAERLWSPVAVRDALDMYRRLEVTSARLEAAGSTHRSGYPVMLKRLTAGQPIEPLRTLADLVQPVKLYERGQLRAYTSSTPLDRLVDAARPESLAARSFRGAVERFLAAPAAQRDAASLRTPLEAWKDNHRLLEPSVAGAPALIEVRPLSKDLAALGSLGLLAVDAIVASRTPPAPWPADARRTVARAGQARAEVEIAVVPAVAKLVLAAASLDTLQKLPPAEWNGWLDSRLEEESGPPRSH